MSPSSLRLAKFAAVASLAISLCGPGSARATGQAPAFTVAPAPSWALGEGQEPASADVTGDEEFRLDDEQIRFEGAKTEDFHRRVWKLLSQSGLENDAQVRMSFEPAYEALVIHEIWVERDGKRLDVLDPKEIKIIQPEAELGEQIYSERNTALFFVKGAKVGDSIGVAYSTIGENPVFDGHVVDEASTAYDVPVDHWRYRVLVPAKVTLFHRASESGLTPRVSERNGERELLWEKHDLKAVVYEDMAPEPLTAQPWLSVADFRDWNDVATWASQLFANPESGEAIRAEVASLRELPEGEPRMLAALRFVQDDVRYLGIEIGLHSHAPHSPEQVLKQRFGDCKDKALLLVTLLRQLGFEADPALVSTTLRERLDEALPSPLDFNHAIVRARLDGKTYWLDATRSLEGGGLADIWPPPFRRALVVSPKTNALEEIPKRAHPETEEKVIESFVELPGNLATLDVETQFTGREANRMRSRIAGERNDELSKRNLDFYENEGLKLTVQKPERIEDDRAKNVLRTFESYKVTAFWDAEGHHSFDAWPVLSEIRKPRTLERHLPMEVAGHNVEYAVRLKPLVPLAVQAEGAPSRGSGLDFSYHFDSSANAVTLDYTLKIDDRVLQPSEVDAYLETVKQIHNSSGYEVARGTHSANLNLNNKNEPELWWASLFVIVLFIAAFGLLSLIQNGTSGIRERWRALRNYRRRRAFKGKFKAQAGHSAATAMPIPEGLALADAVAKLDCDCGGKLALESDATPETITFGGQKIWMTGTRCTRCGTVRKSYVKPPASAA